MLKPLLRWIRDILMGLIERLWALGFAIAGRIVRPAARAWLSPGGQHILAIAPHPDDEAIGCGGVLMLHKQRGDTVWIVYVTDGRQSRSLGLAPAAMAQRRRAEAEISANIVGVDRLIWLGLPEGDWATADARARLGALLAERVPDVIYAPSRVDFHPEHYRVAYALALALADRGQDATLVRVYQVQVPLTPRLTNLVADVSGIVPQSRAMLQAYVSQWYSVARTLRQRRYSAALYGARAQAEEFWELPAGRYRALHAFAPDQWSATIFRGLRFYPWSDPLAYLRGRSARRRIARELVAAEAGGRGR